MVINLIGNSNALRRISYKVFEGDESHPCHATDPHGNCLGKPVNIYSRGCLHEEICRDDNEKVFIGSGQDKNILDPAGRPIHKVYHDPHYGNNGSKVLNVRPHNKTHKDHDHGHDREKKSSKPIPSPKNAKAAAT